MDEAGKGSVLGPMVVAAVGGSSASLFEERGFSDSKTLSPARREELYKTISSEFETSVIVIEAQDIDTLRREKTMNLIVAEAHAAAISGLGSGHAFCDACDVNPERFSDYVRSYLSGEWIVTSEHHADSRRPVVAAASIVAKVERDRAISQLSQEYGSIGSGYPSDPVTIAYLSVYLRENLKAPPCARTSWKTIERIRGVIAQSSLGDFTFES